ncbi:hypothetical protein [Paenibacillus etheri]|uniref:hypothetical protein n=1 Tax=Paenibacillus etheri TaxID=1306852 RepID=UPI0009E9F138|nr:hypothetical protein [Paenibacillus etheri]
MSYQSTQQIKNSIQQLIHQTEQASQNYQRLLQQEQQNAHQLDQLAQRERQAANTIQSALQGHQVAIQQLQSMIQVCNQIESNSNNFMSNNNAHIGYNQNYANQASTGLGFTNQ